VHERIRALLAERAGAVGRLSGTEKLSATLGLSSLDLALLVAELEAQLGVDPFAKLVSITSVRSVDDLVRAYQQAFFPERERREDDTVTAAVKRAQTRRARTKRR
jgi:acyl carrier protein